MTKNDDAEHELGDSIRMDKMATEQDHLAQLREALLEMESEPGRDPAADKAIKVLLRVAIAHHESAGAAPVQAVIEHPPSFMESGEVQAPIVGSSGGKGG